MDQFEDLEKTISVEPGEIQIYAKVLQKKDSKYTWTIIVEDKEENTYTEEIGPNFPLEDNLIPESEKRETIDKILKGQGQAKERAEEIQKYLSEEEYTVNIDANSFYQQELDKK